MNQTRHTATTLPNTVQQHLQFYRNLIYVVKQNIRSYPPAVSASVVGKWYITVVERNSREARFVSTWRLCHKVEPQHKELRTCRVRVSWAIPATHVFYL